MSTIPDPIITPPVIDKPTIALADLDYELLTLANDKLKSTQEVVTTHTANLLKYQGVVNEYLGKLCSLNSMDIADFSSFTVDSKTKILTLERKK
jgi:hypothetical protein